MLSNIQRSKPKPPHIVIYGTNKVGKSTFGALAEKPVFIRTEDGTSNIEVDSFPLATSCKEVMSNLADLATKPHDYKTVVIDSVDWLEPMIHRQICEEQKVKNLEAIGYGKGYVMAMDLWREYLSALKYLRDEIGMTTIQIAHSEIKRFENPETEAYDRYQVKLHKMASDLILEFADIIFFANHFVGVTKNKQGFGQERVRAVGGGDRFLYSEERPAFKAGNRFGLPDQIPFDPKGEYWNVIKQHVPYYNQKKGN